MHTLQCRDMIVSYRGSRREPVVKKGGNTVIPSFYLYYLQIKGLFYFNGIICSSIGTIRYKENRMEDYYETV